jgi:tetratricopeptide (TPR) repeat protein
MATQQERIAQFRKMANDDPDNELGHFSLGKALLDAGQFDEAATSFSRVIELNPQFSKAYQLLGNSFGKAGQRDRAVKAYRDGFAVADERGDNMPRDEMAAAMRQLGEEPPAPKKAAAGGTAGGGFPCQRPGCHAGSNAHQLPKPPINDELGKLIHERVCADCWREWLAMGVKVINELRLDLSDERSQQTYDNYMREFLGLQS